MKFVLLAIILLVSVYGQMEDFYDPVTSKSMLYYAKAAYCTKDQIQNWNGQACEFHPNMESITVITNFVDGAQLYTAYDQDANAIILSVRGSQNIQNWLDNLNYKKTDYEYCDGCQVHKGFYGFWQDVQDETIQAYNNLKSKYSGAKTYVTGHSLGAAVATLAALELRHQGNTIDLFYIFGCPRVGNEQFAVYGAQQLPYEVEVIHYHDPVPHVPLAAQGFVRIPTECYYNKKNNDSAYEWCPSKGGEESSKCSDKLLLATSISDHLHYLGVYTGCTDVESSVEYVENEMYQYKVGTGLQKFAAMEQMYKAAENAHIPDTYVTGFVDSIF